MRPDTLSGGAWGRNSGSVAAAGAADADVSMREISESGEGESPAGALFHRPGSPPFRLSSSSRGHGAGALSNAKGPRRRALSSGNFAMIGRGARIYASPAGG